MKLRGFKPNHKMSPFIYALLGNGRNINTKRIYVIKKENIRMGWVVCGDVIP